MRPLLLKSDFGSLLERCPVSGEDSAFWGGGSHTCGTVGYVTLVTCLDDAGTEAARDGGCEWDSGAVLAGWCAVEGEGTTTTYRSSALFKFSKGSGS